MAEGGALPSLYAGLATAPSSGADGNSASRSARPSLPETVTYEVTAETVPSGQNADGSVVDGAFSIPLAVGYKWRIIATMKANINGTEVAILTDTYEMSEAITAENPILTHDFVLKPISDGVGKVSLGFSGGGVFFNGEGDNASVFTMSAGSISDNKTTNNDSLWAPAAGGVFLDNYSKFVMSGTASINDNSTILDSAGVKVNTQTDTFEMNGGVISGNEVTDGLGGRNITGIHVAGNFKISGNAYIASDNNLYLEEGKYITISGALNPPAAANGIVATITPHSYERTDALLVAETEVTLANESGKFAVKDNDTTDITIWTLDSEGKLLGP
ncbi:MAG: hypothetical protein K5930_03190 [Treponemataceae bacterium]|nr:hypothetical protein [Treponemataceae bacterium]